MILTGKNYDNSSIQESIREFVKIKPWLFLIIYLLHNQLKFSILSHKSTAAYKTWFIKQFKANRKALGSSKKSVLSIFEIALRWRNRREMLSVFVTTTSKQNFWKTKTLILLYETAFFKANVNANGRESRKWTYRKKGSSATKYFIF